METQVRTPQMVFQQPQRLVVPLFQRPYVWNQENQWEPLWNDVVRVVERLLKNPLERQQPHFLGAVVLQQTQNQVGLMQQRTIIDGQQRLTTLQLLMDALHAELVAIDAVLPARRIEPLIENAEPFRVKTEDRFKVWPTNRDRPAFNAVMGGDVSAGNESAYQNERIAEAYRFFGDQAREWLTENGADDRQRRAAAVETVVRDYLQMVVIDLGVDENAQEIFETLNARGAQLTAADLIKNFIFQKLLESGADVEDAYEKQWKDFETGFWETEVSSGRVRYPRSSIFLNHWLIARTGDEVVTRQVFDRFKRFAEYDAGLPMARLLDQIHAAAGIYRGFITKASTHSGAIDRFGLFGYRTSVLESEVIKPFVLYLLDPEQPQIPEPQLLKALDAVESWMVRRMLVRATTKSYSQVIAEIVMLLRKGERAKAGDVVEEYLARQSSARSHWPDDNEIREELSTLLAYRRLGRGRLRMILEAIEDYQRGWKGDARGLGGERVARSAYAIEHVMPRKWASNWPLTGDGEGERDRLIHTIGNLTLLTGRLNTKVSNGPWQGTGGKREGLEGHDVLLLNRELIKKAGDHWSEAAIKERTQELTEIIIRIWPVPDGHTSGFSPEIKRPRKKVQIADLINAGKLSPGIPLFPRRKKFSTRTATLLPDGRIEIDGHPFATPSMAAVSITGAPANGWSFFLVDQSSRRSLSNVRRDYIDELSVDADDDDDDGDDDEV